MSSRCDTSPCMRGAIFSLPLSPSGFIRARTRATENSFLEIGSVRRTVWIVPAVALLACLTLIVDEPVRRLFDTWFSRDIQKLLSNFSKNGIVVFYAVFGGLYGYARVVHHSAIKWMCMAYLKAQLLFSFALVRLLKIGIGRARPANGSDFNPFTLESEYNAFPSGHAADVFTGAVILYLFIERSRWRPWRHLPLLYAGLVAFARIAGGVHHTTDVIAGAAIGIGGALFFTGRPDVNSATAHRPAHS